MVSANVSWKLPDYNRNRDQWDTISDCIAGEKQIKFRRQKYLIPPVPLDVDDTKILSENQSRYQTYLQGALFYNVTARTLRGMVGQIFARPPEIVVPSYLRTMLDDVSGLGVQVVQQQKEVSGKVTAHGRAGLFSDFPTQEVDEDGRERAFSVADIQSGRVKPTITKYEAKDIINWRYSKTTFKKLLLVVIEERYYDETDMYITTEKTQFRVLRIDETGFYIQEVYREYNRHSFSMPTFADGSRFDYIPFEFVGSEDNDPTVDEAPLYPLASVNIGHYNNSAQYEEMLAMMGQPTLVLTGLDQQWVNSVLGGKVYLGSRSAIPLPKGASAEILQMDDQPSILAAMQHKERQMVALGARLVEQERVQRTATEAAQEEASETSILSTVADNVSAAYANAFYSAARFIDRNPPEIVCKLNTQFELQTLDSATQQAVINSWIKEAISFTEMRNVMRRAGYAFQPDKEARAEIDRDREAMMALNPALDPDNVGNNQPPTQDDA